MGYFDGNGWITRRGTQPARSQRRRLSQQRPSQPAGTGLESLECRCLLAADMPVGDPIPPELETAVVSGRKWQDDNADGVWNGRERGLGDVTIYADLNRNGRLDRREPSVRTEKDIPETDFDEGGLYTLEIPADQLPEGQIAIREVVPRGFRQTYPGVVEPRPDDESFVHVDPPFQMIPGIPGEPFDLFASVIIEPTCIRPYELDVVASSPDVQLENTSGVQINGCGGDVSHFEMIATLERPTNFDVLFVDQFDGSVIARMPVMTDDAQGSDGAHVVHLQAGDQVSGLDFGNRPVHPQRASVTGVVWSDANGNGQRDEGEQGLAGTTVYVDLNHNGRHDRREPMAVSQRDDSDTEANETGRYTLRGLQPGEYTIRQIVPRHYRQTFPGVGAEVISTELGRMNDGIALDLSVTDVAASTHTADDPHESGLAADMEVTVVWPDTCGTLIDDQTHSTVVGDHIVVDMAGHQVGDACAEVISPQSVTLNLPNLRAGRYDVVTILHETIHDGRQLPTLTATAQIALGGPGAHQVTVAEGQTVSEIDFGNQSTLKPGAITGIKWDDLNGNGQRDDGEPGLPGVTIYLDQNRNGVWDESEPSTVTAEETGRYTFEVSETERSYSVREVVPEGYYQTFPTPLIWRELPDGPQVWPPHELPPDDIPPGEVPPEHWWHAGAHEVYVPSGETVEHVDFGNAVLRPSSISGTKWLDENGNGTREDNERGLAGVTIYLDQNWNGRLDADEVSVETRDDDPNTPDIDETGRYRFDQLNPNVYQVREVVPEGMEQTYPYLDILRPDGQLIPGAGHYVVLDNGMDAEGLDFGNRPTPEPGIVAGVKWLDLDEDGQRGEDEPGVAGITIYADRNQNGRLDRGEPLTETNDEGAYRLRVRPGEYTIRELLPAGYVPTFPAPASTIRDENVQAVDPLSAISFNLLNVQHTHRADGEGVAELTFEVVWPNGCGHLVPERTSADSDGNDLIRVELVGQVHAGFCDQAIHEQQTTVSVPGVAPGSYLVEAVLIETDEQDAHRDPSYLFDARVALGFGAGGHPVVVHAGDLIDGLDFGNRLVKEGPPNPDEAAGRADLDADGQLSAHDIDLLAAAIRSNAGQAEAHDLSGDGRLDERDLDYLVHDLMGIGYGDVNMDGVFDSSDLVQAFAAGQYEDDIAGNSTWSTGDWDGDGDFTSSDLVRAFQDGYTL